MGLFDDLQDIVWDFAVPGGVDMETRTIQSRNALGEEVPAAVAISLIDPVVIHPIVGAELEKLVEGDRDREHIRVFSVQELQTARAGTSQAAGVLLWDPNSSGNASRYRVITSENHTANSGHWRSIAKKEESA